MGSVIHDWDFFLYKVFNIKDRTLSMLFLYNEKPGSSPLYFSKLKLIEDAIEKGELDLISWITFGLLFRDEPEIGYNAYYIAHLIDHEKVCLRNKI